MESNAFTDFLSAFLAAFILAGLFFVARLLISFLFGAERFENLKNNHNVLWFLAWVGCGILSFFIINIVLMPFMLISTQEESGSLIDILAGELLLVLIVLVLILLWKWILHLMDPEKKCGFWRRVIGDLRDIFTGAPSSGTSRDFSRKIAKAWVCPHCGKSNKPKTLFCQYCNSDRAV